MTRRRPLSRLIASLPMAFALASCAQEGPPPEPPLSEEALEAVAVEPGVSRQALARQVDTLFSANGLGETYAVLVMHRGEIVAERYADGFDAETRLVGWSLSNTVTAVLIGMLIADGRLRLDDPAPIASWQRSGDPRGEITLRHLLQMRSGLRHEELENPVYASTEVRMLYGEGRDNMAAWAETPMLENEPGSTFTYSTATSIILSDIATDVIAPDASADARQAEMAEFLDARLAVPLGMNSMVGEYDAAGTLLGGSAIWASARDWAKFGEFLRHGGSVDGAQIVPRRWVEFMRAPNPAAPHYGAQLWLNRKSEDDEDYLFAEQGPDSAFGLMGHLGQYVIVSPEQHLTVVRFGRTEEPERTALMAELAKIFALYPSR